MTWAHRIVTTICCVVTALITINLTAIYFEGFPLLRSVPVIGRFFSGEIGRRVDAALAGYVTKVEADALRARLAETERQRNAGAQALEEYRRRADAEARLDADRAARTEKAIADDAALDDDAPRVTHGDLEWLRIHQ